MATSPWDFSSLMTNYPTLNTWNNNTWGSNTWTPTPTPTPTPAPVQAPTPAPTSPWDFSNLITNYPTLNTWDNNNTWNNNTWNPTPTPPPAPINPADFPNWAKLPTGAQSFIDPTAFESYASSPSYSGATNLWNAIPSSWENKDASAFRNQFGGAEDFASYVHQYLGNQVPTEFYLNRLPSGSAGYVDPTAFSNYLQTPWDDALLTPIWQAMTPAAKEAAGGSIEGLKTYMDANIWNYYTKPTNPNPAPATPPPTTLPELAPLDTGGDVTLPEVTPLPDAGGTTVPEVVDPSNPENNPAQSVFNIPTDVYSGSYSGMNPAFLPMMENIMNKISPIIDKYNNFMSVLETPGAFSQGYKKFQKNVDRQILDQMANRGILSSSMTENALGEATKNSQNAYLNQLMGIGSLFSDASRLPLQALESTRYSQTQNPLEPYQLMAQILMNL